MYSPKISEKHIPNLYRLARRLRMPMTKIVNQILEGAIERLKEDGVFEEVEKEEQAIAQLATGFARLINRRRTQTTEVIELLRRIV